MVLLGHQVEQLNVLVLVNDKCWVTVVCHIGQHDVVVWNNLLILISDLAKIRNPLLVVS
jgi:hypothetical protein